MREHPILFSAPMILAILAGRKTQTRRVIKRQPRDRDAWPTYLSDGIRFHDDPKWLRFPCRPGDRLWCRETWLPDPPIDGSWSGDVEWNGCGRPISGVPKKYRSPEHCLYAASWIDGSVLHWRPSIHMPRWASRLTLEVTDIRAERLQDISAEDVRAEGLHCLTKDGGHTWKYGIPDRDGLPGTDDYGWEWNEWDQDPRRAFARGWDRINGKRSPWDRNDWVWVHTFRRLA